MEKVIYFQAGLLAEQAGNTEQRAGESHVGTVIPRIGKDGEVAGDLGQQVRLVHAAFHHGIVFDGVESDEFLAEAFQYGDERKYGEQEYQSADLLIGCCQQHRD